MSRLIRVFAFGTLLLGLTAARARADLTISGSNVFLGAGGVGTMDITISSGSGDMLSSFGLELLIQQASGTTSFLQFTSSPDPYNGPNYVFYQQSFNQDFGGSPFWGAPYPATSSPPDYPNDRITGGDSADTLSPNFTNYPMIPGTASGPSSYLATVSFQAAPGATIGDTWSISLVADPGFTYFDDQNGGPLNYNTSGTSSVLGTVTITPQVASIPEPTSAITGLTGAALLTAYGVLRIRRPK